MFGKNKKKEVDLEELRNEQNYQYSNQPNYSQQNQYNNDFTKIKIITTVI